MRNDPPAVVPFPGRGARKIELHRLDALPERPHREEVIEGLIAAGELVAWIGKPGVGKTAAMVLLAISVAEARTFLGRRVAAGPVVYIAAEKGQEVQRRLLAIRKKAAAPVYITMSRPNLADMADIKSLIAEIEKVCEAEPSCPRLIIVDTLARSMPDLNEDRAIDASRVIEGLASLLEAFPTASIVFSHHVVKQSKATMRGSSALLAGVDLCLSIEPAKANARNIVVVKANAIDEAQTLPFRLVPATYREAHDTEDEVVISAEAVKTGDTGAADSPAKFPKRSRQLLELIQQRTPIRRPELLELAREAGIVSGSSDASRVAFNRALDQLCDTIFVAVDDDGIVLIP